MDTRMVRPFRSVTLITALSSLAVASQVTAQVRVTPAERGWVGVSVELLTTVVRGRGTSVVTVTEVSEGSPAEGAGVRPGDVLVSMNGRGGDELISLGAGPVPAGLVIRPGDAVRLVLERDGARREVTLQAGRRPERLQVTATWSFRVSRDSVADRMFRAMDSLKLRLFREPGRTVAQVGDSPRTDARVEVVGQPVVVESPPGLPRWEPYRLPAPVAFPELQAPFALLVLAGPERDSLRFELGRLNREIREVSNLHALRLRRLDSDDGRAGRSDPELRRIEGTLSELRERSVELQASIERAASLELYGGSGWTAPRTPDVADEAVFRPLAPYVLGQRRAAGAEVVDLRPELADYFGVRGGVLVVDVAEGTPAALAGILPGDVLTSVNGAAVASIAELRSGLARAEADAAVDVVRKGRMLRLRLSR